MLSEEGLESVLGSEESKDVDDLFKVCASYLILECLVLAEGVLLLHLLMYEQSEKASACVWLQVTT